MEKGNGAGADTGPGTKAVSDGSSGGGGAVAGGSPDGGAAAAGAGADAGGAPQPPSPTGPDAGTVGGDAAPGGGQPSGGSAADQSGPDKPDWDIGRDEHPPSGGGFEEPYYGESDSGYPAAPDESGTRSAGQQGENPDSAYGPGSPESAGQQPGQSGPPQQEPWPSSGEGEAAGGGAATQPGPTPEPLEAMDSDGSLVRTDGAGGAEYEHFDGQKMRLEGGQWIDTATGQPAPSDLAEKAFDQLQRAEQGKPFHPPR